MRIAFYSTSPHAASGYGTQTKMLLPRLKADGHDVAVLGLWGNQAGMASYETPYGPIPIFPAGAVHYGLDVVDAQAKAWLGDKPGWVMTLYDVWVLADKFKDRRTISWTPVDHYPVPRKVVQWAEKHPTIAMSRFGQAAFADAGVTSTYIPHGIEKFWKPSPSNVRQQMDVPDDAFLVMMNAANIGASDRKGWNQNLRAFAAFARNHPDAVIYLHTDPTRPDGFPIARYLHYLGLDEKQTRITDLFAYRSGLIDQGTLAQLYTAADVLLSCSLGEGFGLPVAESMACGTPAIVTDFSAQPEIVGDTGWKVPWEPFWDRDQIADFAIPSVSAILDSLEEAYAERGSARATERALAAEAHIRAEYDADTVYERLWRPLIADMEAQLQPAKERPGMSKAAKRRMKK